MIYFFFFVKLLLSEEWSRTNKRWLFQAIIFQLLSASVLPVMSKSHVSKRFHLIWLHESLHITAADAQNTAACIANSLSSPSINIYAQNFGRIFLKVSPSKEGKRCNRNSPKGKEVCIFAFKVSIKHLEARGEFSLCAAVSEAHRAATPGSTDKPLLWKSNSSVEVSQASTSLRYYSCMISRARDLYKLDMSWKIWIMCCIVQQRVIYRPLLCNKTIVCWEDIYGIILYVLIVLFRNI